MSMAVPSVPADQALLKKQVHTGQEGLSPSSSRQTEQVVMRSKPSTATASQHAIHQRE